MHRPKIKVFWDLESCPPPHSYDGSPWDLLKAIRLFTVRFGVVNSFKAYWDLSRCSTTNTESLRAAMPSMGISLVDCSLVKEYDRDALSRTLAVEVLVSAVDSPTNLQSEEPGIIMIFSGDRIAPDQSNHLVSSRATRVFNWNTDVLDPKQRRSPASVSVPNMGQSSQSKPGAGSLEASGTKRPFAASNHDVPPHLISSPTVNADVTIPTSQLKSPRIAIQQPLQPFTSSAIAPSMSPGLFRGATSTPVTPRTKPAGVSALSDPSGSRAASVLSRDSSNQPSSFSSPLSLKPRKVLSGSPEKRPSGLEQSRPEPMPQFEVIPTDDWGMNSSWNEGGGWEVSDSDWSVKPEKQRNGLQEEVVATTGLAIAELYPVPLPDLHSHVEVEMPLLDSSPADDTVFLPLLQCLQRAKTEGKDQLLRSVIGSELSRNKDIYRAAGTPSFGGYVALAAQKGLVSLGGIGGKAWVSLS